MNIQSVALDNSGTHYAVTLVNGTICFVPYDSKNSDYLAVTAWIAAGNVVASVTTR